jgi:hypothetical protein
LYGQVPEADILAGAEAALERLHQTGFGLSIPASSSPARIVEILGAYLRAMETRYTEIDCGDRFAEPVEHWRIELEGESAFFIPLRRIAWREPKDPERDIRSFDRRGLVRVRIIPSEVDGSAVQVYRAEHLRKRPQRTFGAVLFPDLKFATDDKKDEKTFLVTGVTGPRRDEIIRAACEKAHAEDCVAVVFPELTIDHASRARIEDLLLSKPWSDGADAEHYGAPGIIVAGSWHEPSATGFVNAATVYDSVGDEVLTYRKRYVYVDEKGIRERIEAGNEFPVLAVDEGLFTFGICLDFCNRCFDVPYGALDVDYVAVPSCANCNTMKDHINTAQTLVVRRSTRSFVIQQACPSIADGHGYLLPPDGNTRDRKPGDLKTAETWTLFREPAAAS